MLGPAYLLDLGTVKLLAGEDKLNMTRRLALNLPDRPGWIAVMKGAISKNAAYFNSHRMMRRYATEAYLR